MKIKIKCNSTIINNLMLIKLDLFFKKYFNKINNKMVIMKIFE